MFERRLRMGEVYRYSKPYSSEPARLDGYPNYFHLTWAPDKTLSLLDSGINPIAEAFAPEGKRRPAILISSSPHKIGSAETPWQDFFNSDNGHIRYYGDNKSPNKEPVHAAGNSVLLRALESHQALSIQGRESAVPLVYFRRVSKDGKRKGFVRFEGFGVIERAELVVQYDRANERTFTNYVYDFMVMSLAKENEAFDWSWIAARRDESLSLDNSLAFAPESWKLWLKEGMNAQTRIRRQVSKLLTYSASDQKPGRSSRAEQALEEVYRYYRDRRSRFEALAVVIAEQIISGSGGIYRRGWITPASGDGGADFIGRMDIGSGLASVKLIVLGQAKCEDPSRATGGNHIARTVARLRRGWIGVYVTTSHFSEQVQREVIDDQYPIILINGKRLAEEVLDAVYRGGYSSTEAFLNHVDAQYESMIRARLPEEILLD